MNSRGFSLAAVTVAGVIVLASCAPTPESSGAPPASPDSTTTQAAPAPSTGSTDSADTGKDTAPKAGETVSKKTAKKLNSEVRNAASDRAYKMPDGEYVFVPGGQPLPKKVKKVVEKKTNVPERVNFASTTEADDHQIAIKALAAALEAQEAATGRQIVPVIHGLGYDSSTGKGVPMWTTSSPGPNARYSTKSEAVAAAQEWVDLSPATRMMVIVDGFK